MFFPIQLPFKFEDFDFTNLENVKAHISLTKPDHTSFTKF